MANCVKCGAPLQLGNMKCEYCGSVAEPPRSFSSEDQTQQPSPQDRGIPRHDAEVVRFKRASIFVMILLTCFTFGIYIMVWYWLRRESLMNLDPAQSKRTDTLIKGLVGLQVLNLLSFFTPDLMDMNSWISLCMFAISVYLPFYIRSLLRSYVDRVFPRNPASVFIATSYIWTLVFNIFYLQSQINRMIDARLLDAQI